MNKLFEEAHSQLDAQAEQSRNVIKASAHQLLKLKQPDKQEKPSGDKSSDDWTIEYEE